jgi:hypothetical protein
MAEFCGNSASPISHDPGRLARFRDVDPGRSLAPRSVIARDAERRMLLEMVMAVSTPILRRSDRWVAWLRLALSVPVIGARFCAKVCVRAWIVRRDAGILMQMSDRQLIDIGLSRLLLPLGVRSERVDRHR